MKHHSIPRRHLVSCGGVLILSSALAGCGGGGDDGGSNLMPPTLADAEAQTLAMGQSASISFTNSGGGSLTGCTVRPTLPTGLSVGRASDGSTCIINGIPSVISDPDTYIVTATNAAGSDNASIVITVNIGGVATTPPAFAEVEAQAYTNGVRITDLVLSNTGGGSLTRCLDEPNLPAGLSVDVTSDNSTCVITGTPMVVSAQRSYTITASNAIGDGDTSVDIAVRPAIPVLADADAQTYTVGVEIADLVFDNSGGGSLTRCASEPTLPAGLSVEVTSDNSSCVITGIPAVAIIRMTFAIIATNDGGDGNASVGMTILPTAPSLVDSETRTFTAGQSVTISIRNIGGGSLIDCSSQPTLPSGLSVRASSNNATCVITGIPTGSKVEQTYIITATNATNSNSVSVNITILPSIPSLVNIETTRTIDTGENVAISFENRGGGSLTDCSSKTTLPSGLSAVVSSNKGTCVITGIPTSSKAEETYTITAENISGTVNATVNIAIRLTSPSLTDLEDRVLGRGQTVSIVFSNNGGNELNDCDVNPGLPTGLSVERTSGNISCEIVGVVPADSVQETYIVTATNSAGPDDGASVNLNINPPAPDLQTPTPLEYPALIAIDTFTFVNDGGNGLSDCAAESLPDGLTLEISSDKSTCQLTGTPITPRAATMYSITATNITGSDSVNISIEIEESPLRAFLPNSVDVTDTTAQLNWINQSDAISFEVWRAEIGDGEVVSRVGTNVMMPSYTDTTLATNTDYYYLITECTLLTPIKCLDPSNSGPKAIAALASAGRTELDGPRGVAITTIGGNTYAIVSAFFSDSVHIIDISTPTNPSLIASLRNENTLDGARGVATTTNNGKTYALVATQLHHSVQIIDISEPTDPRIVASVEDDGNQIALNGATAITTFTKDDKTYALVAALLDDGIQIIDISDPEDPDPISALFDTDQTILDAPFDVTTTIIDDRIYALVPAFLEDGFQIIDIDNPADPTPVASLTDSMPIDNPAPTQLNGANAVTASVIGGNTYAIVSANSDSGVQIIDITDPNTPVLLSSLSDNPALLLGETTKITNTVIGDRNYVLAAASRDGGVQIIDISNPTLPVGVASIRDTSPTDPIQTELRGTENVATVVIDGKIYAVVAASVDDGIQIIEITTPQTVMPSSSP